MTVQRYRIDIAYDGTDYAGWQVQPNGVTIQQRIEEALHGLTRERRKVHGSGRTDRGVHARRQVAHFDLEAAWPLQSLARGLNALLPGDIRVLRCARAAPGFHARRSAVSKEYRYFIWNGPEVPPFLRLYRTRVRAALDVKAMRAAAGLLVGRHDFASFTANPNRTVPDTVRDLTSLRVTKRGAEVMISVSANGFLYKMVRGLAGLLIRVGEGAVPVAEVGTILRARRRTARVETAPPTGLFLWNVTY